MADGIEHEIAEIAADAEALTKRIEAVLDRVVPGVPLSAVTEEMKAEFDGLPTGRRVSLARQRLGMSQLSLAAKSDFHVNTVLKIENGQTSPRDATLMALAKVLEVPWQLLKGDGDG